MQSKISRWSLNLMCLERKPDTHGNSAFPVASRIFFAKGNPSFPIGKSFVYKYKWEGFWKSWCVEKTEITPSSVRLAPPWALKLGSAHCPRCRFISIWDAQEIRALASLKGWMTILSTLVFPMERDFRLRVVTDEEVWIHNILTFSSAIKTDILQYQVRFRLDD